MAVIGARASSFTACISRPAITAVLITASPTASRVSSRARRANTSSAAASRPPPPIRHTGCAPRASLTPSPAPRAVLYPERLHVSRSLRKTLRKGEYEVRFDSAFRDVVTQCAQPRGDGLGTWLTEEMIEAYCVLHRLGHAHSAESWHDGKLVGGLYGIAIGKVFFGESMFARRSDASKVAFVHLVTQLREAGYRLIDSQIASRKS